VDLSAFYLDVLKDRLYCSPPASHERRSAQTALHFIAQTLAQLLSPIITHTAEEVWQSLPGENKPLSILLSQLPDDPFSVHDAAMLERWEPVLAVRETVNKALEQARQSEIIRRSQEAALHMKVDAETWSALKPFLADLPTLYMVSSVAVEPWDEEEVSVIVRRANGQKCPRCWQIRIDIGTDTDYPELCVRCASAVRAIG
jgi:isoleucyl-tRNA synthetase